MTNIEQVREFLNNRSLYRSEYEDLKKQEITVSAETFDKDEALKDARETEKTVNTDTRMIVTKYDSDDLTDDDIQGWLDNGNDVENFDEVVELFLEAYGEEIYRTNLLNVEHLNTTEYDEANNRYYLEFRVAGESISISVDADNYSEAATDEDYFDDEENVKRAVKEAKENGQI